MKKEWLIGNKHNLKYKGNIKKIYNCYRSMLQRCYDKGFINYKYYGGKGITVCDNWKNDYNLFLNWAKSNGWAEGMQLDKDIKGNGMIYSPETCCFINRKENNDNKSNTIKYNYNGEMLTIPQISKITGVPHGTIYHRVNVYNMPIEEAAKKSKTRYMFRTNTHKKK